MSTRRADQDAPLAQNRYASSVEFTELHGISGTATAKRCALLVTAEKRALLLFIQALSLRPGGLRKLAIDLVQMFPKRCDQAKALRPGRDNTRDPYYDPTDVPLQQFLIDLCINPKWRIRLPGEDEIVCELENERADDVREANSMEARLRCFETIIESLVEFKRSYENRVRDEFCLTAIGRRIWQELDYSLRAGVMTLINGREGRGKTEAVRAWCECHLGSARFISLSGTDTKTTQLRQMARALGVGHSACRSPAQMQTNIEEVLQSSRLMPVFDEAHFFFNQGKRIYTRPEMLDWIDTALCNPPMPVALVTTPQFLDCVAKAADQVGWNWRQFRRRCKRLAALPEVNTPEDVELVARKLFPGADKATIKAVLGYVAISKRDLSAVGDVAREAKELAGARQITFQHVSKAINEVLIPSDVPWAEMERGIRRPVRQRASEPVPVQSSRNATDIGGINDRRVTGNLDGSKAEVSPLTAPLLVG